MPHSRFSSQASRPALPQELFANDYTDDVSKREILNDLNKDYDSHADEKSKREILNDLDKNYHPPGHGKSKREILDDLNKIYDSYKADTST